jgi:hypothetical protein
LFKFLFLGCQLKTPCATRWNSEFDSVQFIMSKPEDKVNSLMKKLKLEQLDDADLVLLKQYVTIMSPLAKYLDVLQSEVNSYLGCVIPCIQKIKEAMMEAKDLQPTVTE